MKKILVQAQEFDKKMIEAWKEKYNALSPQIQQSMFKTSFVSRMNLEEFIDLYKKSKYPNHCMQKLIEYLFDIKLELYYIQEVDLGLKNTQIHDVLKGRDINDFPHLVFKKASYDQNLILKSRILMEKVMKFIHYLEKGKEPSSASTRSEFFKLIKKKMFCKTWGDWIAYKKFIDKFDKKIRNKEVHNFSWVRKMTFSGGIDGDVLLAIINLVQNMFWDNLLLILKTGESRGFYWCKAMEDFAGTKIEWPSENLR